MGLFYNPFLIFIALFVWIGAAAEAGSAQIKSTLSGTAVGRAMLTDFQALSPDEPLTRAIELTLAGSQKEFPVLVNEVVVGVLTQTDLLKGLQARGETGPGRRLDAAGGSERRHRRAPRKGAGAVAELPLPAALRDRSRPAGGYPFDCLIDE